MNANDRKYLDALVAAAREAALDILADNPRSYCGKALDRALTDLEVRTQLMDLKTAV